MKLLRYRVGHLLLVTTLLLVLWVPAGAQGLELPPRPRDAERPVINGFDFLSGSKAVDAATFAGDLLAAKGSLVIDARWMPAEFEIRPTDATGLPLIGPSSDGVETGSLMRYRLGWAPSGNIVPFLAIDYYVATHIDRFFTLMNPFAGFGALFTGAKRTGFAAVAGQVFPGLQVNVERADLEVRGGYIFRFRDPVDKNGRFLSDYQKNNFTGRYEDGDYGGYPVPDGEGGFSTGEPYFGATWYGVDLLALLAENNTLALLQLARPLSMAAGRFGLRRVTPALAYVGEAYQNRTDSNVLKASGDAEFVLGKTLFVPAAELQIVPVSLSTAELQLFSRGFLLGMSYFAADSFGPSDNPNRVPVNDLARWGYKVGFGFDTAQSAAPQGRSANTNLRVELAASYNFAHDLDTEPLNLDAWVFSFLFRRRGPSFLWGVM